MEYEPVIGLEVHAELETNSKMFCSCAVVDLTTSQPNVSVCPVCAGMPGVLPVVNQRAVEYAVRVALALECQINLTSIFARKNYFYPDLPKGYQISQYEQPLARNGRLAIQTSQGERVIRIRRVHMEEDTGKLTHVDANGQTYSLVDLNRAGVPLLEIVTEPDLHSVEEVRAYVQSLRSLVRYLGVNSGDLQKGVMRFEPNISIRPLGSQEFGTRVEVKNLNSFRAVERATEYEIRHQAELLEQGIPIQQQTLGWDVDREVTFTQRVKEGEDDYRYFPEPDLPPLVLEEAWVESIRASLPELPAAKLSRFCTQYGLNSYDAGVLVAEQVVANYFEALAAATQDQAAITPKMVSNWISGELFALLNQSGLGIESSPISPTDLAGLLRPLAAGEINNNTAKTILAEMFASKKSAESIIQSRGLRQISDGDLIAGMVQKVLADNPDQVETYLKGKDTVSRWLFGQVMRLAKGQANPQVIQAELDSQLEQLKDNQTDS